MNTTKSLRRLVVRDIYFDEVSASLRESMSSGVCLSCQETDTMPSILTIFFENPYWVAVLEQISEQKLYVARYVLGSAEPSDAEIYAFVQLDYVNLMKRLSEPVALKKRVFKRVNPKRQQRLIQKQLLATGISSQSQEALRRERESNKKEKSTRKKKESQELKEFKRQQRIIKRKEKHRGH